MLLPLVLLTVSTAAKADYNPTDPPEPGVYFSLTTRCNPPDAGYNLTQSGTHAFGSPVYLNIYPNTGYRFIGWKDNDGNLLSSSTSFTYTMPSKNVTVTAHFVYDPSNPSEPTTPVFKDESQIDFAINPADAGYFSGNYNGIYEIGTGHSFTVYSNRGYRFVNWTRNGEVVGTLTTLDYTVPKGDHTLVANFEYDPSNPDEPGEQHFYRKLNLVSNMEGAATLHGAGEYLDGTSHNVYMYINKYYTFVNWTDQDGAIVSTSADFNYTMPNRNVTLTANFTYNFDPSNPDEPGTPNPDGSVGDNMVAWPRMGMYDDTHVLILCETPGSTIHYTLDGTDPTAASPVYTGPVYVSSNLLVKAIAYKEGMEDSPIVSFRVTTYTTGAPVFTFENKMVKITSNTPDAIIRYTVDGSEPTPESTVYTEPFLPQADCTIKAYASKENFINSTVTSYVYSRAEHTATPPTISQTEDNKIVITTTVDGGVTRYTLDGMDPDENSAIYSGPITVTQNCFVHAYTTHTNYFDSPVTNYEVTSFSVSMPVIVFEGKKIKITCPTEDAVILYTVDGSTPSPQSTVYTEPFLPDADCTVKAYARKENFINSTVVSYVYSRAEHTLASPTFSLDGEKRLVINPPMNGCEIHYATSGWEQDITSAIYTEPIVLSNHGSVSAYATHANYFDSPVAEYIISEHQEAAPIFTPHFRERLIIVEHPDGRPVALSFNGILSDVVETPCELAVEQWMTQVSAVAVADNADMLNSLPQDFAVVFHDSPKFEYDGHTLISFLGNNEPQSDEAIGVLSFKGEITTFGKDGTRLEISDFGTAKAYVESDYAFRSDITTMNIDVFNTGRIAGARDYHRLSEVFGSWGDRKEDYTHLVTRGVLNKEDLQFIATLPELTTLWLDSGFATTENENENEYMIPESYDSIFAGTRIETILSSEYPAGMLKGMPRLTNVMYLCSTDPKMTAGRISEAGNPNILFWTGNAANAPEDARNVVVSDNFPSWTDVLDAKITGRADVITLETGYPFNIEPGYPFDTHMPLTAKRVEVTKQFDQATEIGVCRGWETIALPITPDSIVHENGTELVPFKIWPGTDDAPKPFWLYTATGADWVAADRITAGMPYIISMPNNPQYLDEYNIAGRIKFIATDVTLGTEDSAPLTTGWKESMLFHATFMPPEDPDMLSLNTQGEDNGVSGSIFTTAARTLPFGAYVTGAGSRKRVAVFGDSGISMPTVSASGITVETPAPGTIRISATYRCTVPVTAISGMTVANAVVQPGESVCVEGLAKGIYIVAGMKIIVK